MNALEEVRSRPFDTGADGADAVLVDVRTPVGFARVGVSRLDAVEALESALFSGGVAIISVSGWEMTLTKRPIEYAECLAVLHQVFGGDVLPKLRRVSLGGGAIYFMGLVSEDKFIAPTPMQDAALARNHEAVPALP